MQPSKVSWHDWPPEQKENFLRQLRLRRTTSAGLSTYSPRGACDVLQRDRSGEVLISGPAGTGKSRACLEKLHRLSIENPRARSLIVRKTRESLSESALFTYEAWVLGPDNPIAKGPNRRLRAVYRYPNGSEIVVGGLDKPSKLMSTEYDLIYVQEAIELLENDWESLTTRLRNNIVPFQQILADTNPSAPSHWLKRRADAGKTTLLESTHHENPNLWDDENGVWTEQGLVYLARLAALTGARKERYYAGRWVQAEGLIYEGWDPSTHLVDEFVVPASWDRFRTIDFGFTNPAVCQWWALDGDGRMFLYRELYHAQWTAKALALRVAELSGSETFLATICDHDAGERATLEENGIKSMPAEKDVTAGINHVMERLVLAGDKRPRLYVMRGACVEIDQALNDRKLPYSTEQEFDSYVWQDKSKKEQPVKEHDHGLDALRYAVMYADGPRGVLFS